ncbi:MAG: leucine-rich repeat protein [Treponema sp.]|jgi:hypothetical protein|nr:leucine-rich repeat protein [Treponema sp.]
MEKLTFKKNGLIYTDDFKVVVGIDSDSKEFTGTVPNGVTSIEEEAFSCCGLKEISLPDSVDYLGANLFCNCTELESVRLPANLKILPPFLFCGCKSLKKVEMPLEIQDFSEGLFAECASLEEIPFRSGIKTLPENVFDSCSAIKSLIIPDSVTKICANAIANCENLETIVLPAKLETVEKDWISNCPKLKHIRISDENSLFKTDEENCVLYKIVDGEKIPLLTLENKSEESLPGFKEPDTENSIITFDENEDETMDDTNIFNTEPEDSKNDSEMDARLAEILGQNKMYDDGDFSIMDIPQASEEEIDSNILKSTEPEEERFKNDSVVQFEVPVEEKKVPEENMEDKLKDILSQNVGDFSINDIPVASEDELAANKILEQTEEQDSDEEIPVYAEKMETEEEIPLASEKTESNPELDEKNFMQNLVFETQKVLQQNTGIEGEPRILFVFAENLVSTPLGEKFSVKLQKCCTRLAKIHKFTSVYYFYNTRLENEKFRNQFIDFIANKDVLVACDGANLYDISDRTVAFCGFVKISLAKEDILQEMKNSKNSDWKPLKLIIQDNLEE